ncbi:hypothetical protein LOZ58_004431 [Ophidiomyces ophidiicola]|uniref:uncharacterized protein n=1 Tax=Ophidiomyces ophidiicola TaxID=1387563 RepID=UPI0020C48661|nr:uncharacterized protein LOZ57_005741 [Ophidiomyces ophidiicola]KAI1933136.1 hypothetical protein LOZ65_000345 [Ophidiomyces ophidiicola]KAI1938685.1 hypothetical protein LOZ66_003488 [Ophidiomyces ophidiicola]KAI1941051.1 hypothetical protein LOZ57_005741 [Ophidiomyces ophidiicola]KAI1959622.1 hypothetical protein LOZ58_004431 [Ophidiomyces ophidiicola]KAI2128592.1 hypothetical protein LOZ31_001902 [Ophidiomyces ophidiicola]
MRAYLICRNFSVNDGMYPAGHDHGGIIQGVPVAIGTGRRSRYHNDDIESSVSDRSRSGGSSPQSCEDRQGNASSRALHFGSRVL